MSKAKTATGYVYKTMRSPVGLLTLVGSDRGLAAVLWENDNPKRIRRSIVGEDTDHPVLIETERQLNEYFTGKRKAFSVPLDFVGTEFQRSRSEKPVVMVTSPRRWDIRRQCARSARRTGRTPFPLSHRAIALSVRQAS